MNHYYVYILRDPRRDNEPFYVGKGSGRRVRVHLTENKKSSENSWKYSKIQKIREAGLEPVVEYYATDLVEDDAYDLEARLIKQYGRAKIDEGGILTNRCMDNRPPPYPIGQPMREEIKQKIGNAQRGEKNHRYGDHWPHTEKQRRREFNRVNGIKPPVRTGPMSQAQKDAIAAGNRGKRRTPEQSAYLSSIRRGKKTCAKRKKPLADLVGQQFGAWTVLALGADRRTLTSRGPGSVYWVCRCVCSKERQVNQRNLTRGTSKSCGCRGS